MKRVYISVLVLLMIIINFISCKNNSGWEHSAALLIKGREVKMSMYGPYHDAIDQWNEVKSVLDKIKETHSQKIVLIRVIDPPKGSDELITNYVIRKVEKYLNKIEVSYEIRDERSN